MCYALLVNKNTFYCFCYFWTKTSLNNKIGIEMVDELGGKVQSSSWLLAKTRGEDVVVKTDPNA